MYLKCLNRKSYYVWKKFTPACKKPLRSNFSYRPILLSKVQQLGTAFMYSSNSQQFVSLFSPTVVINKVKYIVGWIFYYYCKNLVLLFTVLTCTDKLCLITVQGDHKQKSTIIIIIIINVMLVLLYNLWFGYQSSLPDSWTIWTIYIIHQGILYRRCAGSQ